MKVAYLATVHKNPKLLERAIAMLATRQAGVFVHLDQKADARNFTSAAKSSVFVSDRTPVVWGEFSQVEATMQLIRHALSCPEEYQYFVFLQGSDYPLRSGSYIQRFLERHQGCEFINLRRMPAAGYPLSKVNTLRYATNKPVRRFLARTMAKLGLGQRDYTKYLRELGPYAGQAYWTLSRAACQYIVDFSVRNPHVERYFRDAFTSDEMFFHTILGNSPFLPRVRRSLMFVQPNWSILGETRHQLSEEHLRFFESRDEVWVKDEWGSGEVLFARKLSDDRLDVVDRIDAMIGRKENSAPSRLRPQA